MFSSRAKMLFRTPLRHPWYTALFVWLLFLTFTSLTSNYLTEAPFDARTGAHVAGLSLSYPAWGALLEPVTALAHINAGAPDLRVATISFLCWCLLAPLLVAALRDRLGRRNHNRKTHYRRAALLGVEVSLLFIFYFVFALLAPFPTWHLHDDRTSDIIGDLHSHTLFSHDGLVTPSQSLAEHRRIGDQVIAFTEHEKPPYYSIKAKNTGILPGVEVGAAFNGTYVLGLGIQSEKYTPIPFNNFSFVEKWIKQVHQVHKGAVLAMYIHLRPKDIDHLVSMGVDAFEIVNGGHPPPSDAMKAALIRAQKKYGIALLADSDWHGWGTLIQQWNVFRSAAGTSSTPPEQRVVDSLRHHGRYDIIPVTSYHNGQVSWLHALFSPLIETYRYAGELSPMRLAGWWLWGGIAVWMAGWCRARRIDPIKAATAAGLAFMGTSSIIVCLIRLYEWLPYREVNHFAGHIYLEGLCLSILPLFAARAVIIQSRQTQKTHEGTLFLSRREKKIAPKTLPNT